MANTLTGLLGVMYAALNNVSRERVGFVPAVARDARADGVAIGQSLTVPIGANAAAADNTPGVTAPDTGDAAQSYTTITISNSKHVPIRWTGEETLGTQSAGTYEDLMRQRFEHAFRTLGNLIEADLAAAAYKGASRAYGTAGTTPFATAGDFSDFAQVAKILDDNGCPTGDMRMVLGNAAVANIRGKQSNLFKVNEAGTDAMLRMGSLGQIEGFWMHQSGQVVTHTKGTGTSYQSNNGSGYAVGDTTIALDTGSGTMIAGDVVTFTGDTNKYIVGTALSGGSMAINAPGLRATLADNVAVAIGNNYAANVAFDRSAILLATRAPAKPEGGDAAVDIMTVQDPVSGLVFEVAHYRQYLQNTIHVRIAWGVKVINSQHVAILLG